MVRPLKPAILLVVVISASLLWTVLVLLPPTHEPSMPAPLPPPPCPTISPCYTTPPHDTREFVDTRVCVVVRTWSGHAASGQLEHMLTRVLARQSNSNWHAIIVDTDTSPWPPNNGLEELIQRANDSRIVPSHRRASRPFNELYSYVLTDSAIAQCPSDCSWLLVTNADNDHHPDTFATVDPDFDFISFDFFSRHWRYPQRHKPLPTSCATLPESFVVLKNQLTHARVDLASVVYSLRRFRAESVYFTDLQLDRKHLFHDGQMAKHIVGNNWRGKRLDEPLMSHSPNAWECSRPRGYTTFRTVMSGNCSLLDEPHIRELALSKSEAPSAYIQTLDANWEPVSLPCFDDGPWEPPKPPKPPS